MAWDCSLKTRSSNSLWHHTIHFFGLSSLYVVGGWMTEIPIKRVHTPPAQRGSIKVLYDEVSDIILQTHEIQPTTAGLAKLRLTEERMWKKLAGCYAVYRPVPAMTTPSSQR